MAEQNDFEKAQVDVKNLTKRPNNNELLELYALYKQATAGDVSGKRPGMLKIADRAKFDAWTTKKGTSADQAVESYVEVVSSLISSYGLN
ncbi:acyl-CoA-binding protein [Bacteriovoracaceae bacterium]|nr:acyl-CoA-binding protein [Bacteriovoracaceae bacterium]